MALVHLLVQSHLDIIQLINNTTNTENNLPVSPFSPGLPPKVLVILNKIIKLEIAAIAIDQEVLTIEWISEREKEKKERKINE